MAARAMAAGLAAFLAAGAAACGSVGRAGVGSGSPGPSRRTAAAPADGQTASGQPASSPLNAGISAPTPAHTVVVVMENHSYSAIIGNGQAPFINSLARRGALLTNSHAITHPSEPNYLALFSGSTQGLSDDSCPHQFAGPNLGSELIAVHRSFAGFSEGLPRTGSYICGTDGYARKHDPWVNFSNVPSSANKPFGAFPAGDFSRLPAVSFVIPDLCHDMHDCSVATGDAWLAGHMSGYANWAMTHNSLLIVTWDEGEGGDNHIATILMGQHVRPGRQGQLVTHYGVLRTIESLYRLRPTGQAARARVVAGIWR